MNLFFDVKRNGGVVYEETPRETIHRPAEEQVQLMKDLTGRDVDAAEAAFDEFFADYREVLVYKAQQRLHGVAEFGVTPDAENLVQNIFAYLWEVRETLNPNSTRIYTWLLNAVNNRGANEIRNAAVRQTAVMDMSPAAARLTDEDETPSWEPAHAGPGPEEQADANETAALIQEALQQALNERERKAFVMKNVDERTLAFIAETLGIKPNTVKSTLSTAKRKLREYLAPRLNREAGDDS